jgi:hypothetical protein
MKSPQNLCLRVKWYQAVKIDEKVQILCERATMLRYTYIAYLFELEDLHRLRNFSLINVPSRNFNKSHCWTDSLENHGRGLFKDLFRG